MIQAALYARVSSTRQKQHETIDSQLACLRDHARQRGWEIPGEWVFTDDGWSGATLVRPALERLRDLAAQHLVERVLCLSPDRLARSYAHQVLLVEELTRCGTELVFVNNPEATTPEQVLMVQVQGMIAEYERAQTAERTRRGKRHRARAGAASVLGRAPYGYRYLSRAEYGEAAYAVAEAEAAVVARIFRRYACGGVSMKALARELSHDQIPSPQGNDQWDAGTLGRMLRNPAYMGRAAFGKTQSGPGLARPNRTSRLAERSIPSQPVIRSRPREEWIEIPVPALVTEEVFALVQRRLAENAKFSPRNTRQPVLLQGLLVCDVCGYSYTRTSQGPGPKKYYYYRCPGTNGWELPGGKVCSSRPLRAPDLEELIWKQVVALLADPVLIRQELQRRLEHMRAAGPVPARQERLRQQITRLDGAISRLVGAYQEELITLEELRERIPRLRAQRQSLHSQLEALAAQLVDQQAYLKLAENLEGFLARLRERAQTTSVLERQRVLRAVVKEVRIGPEKITIRHSIPSTSPDPTPGYLLRCGSPHHRDLRGPAACGCLPDPAAAQPGRCGHDVRPNLITHVATTDATVHDSAVTPATCAALDAKGLAPSRLYADSGYASAHNAVTAARAHGITLVTPMLAGSSRQAREKAGYDRSAFTADYDARTVTCPQGQASHSWYETAIRGKPAVIVTFHARTCRPCPARAQCTTARGGRGLTLPPRELYDLQAAARAGQDSKEWQQDCKRRAGIEATISQAITVTGTRRARYRGLPRTRLEHVYAAVALNLWRLDAYWNDTPLDRTRTSHLARLDQSLRLAALPPRHPAATTRN